MEFEQRRVVMSAEPARVAPERSRGRGAGCLDRERAGRAWARILIDAGTSGRSADAGRLAVGFPQVAGPSKPVSQGEHPMNNATLSIAAAALAVALAPTAAQAQEESDNSVLAMTKIYLEPVSWMKFGQAMEEYIGCYAENGGEDSWSAWRDMEMDVIWVVSTMDGWAEMDEERSEANRACYPIIEENMGSLVRKVKTEYAEYMPDWSGESEDYDVVRLHQLVVDDGSDFREVMGEMVSIVKEAEYEHVGAWYSMVGSDADEVDYFNVEHYENFAAMDVDRAGYYGVVAEAKGEEAAGEMWEDMVDSLADDGMGYSTVLLSRAEDWSYQPDEE
jgi:hypothetical protein